MKYTLFISLFLFALVLSGCKNTTILQPTVEVAGQKVAVAGGSYTDASVAELQTMLAKFITGHILRPTG